jgi:hypothetical protein
MAIAKAEAEFSIEPPAKNKDFVIGHSSQVSVVNKKPDAWEGLTNKQKNCAY